MMFDPPLPWFSKNWKVFCTRSTTQMPDQKCCKPRWGGDVGTRPHPHSSITAPFSGQKEACSTRSTSSYLLMYGLSGWCFSGWISRDLPRRVLREEDGAGLVSRAPYLKGVLPVVGASEGLRVGSSPRACRGLRMCPTGLRFGIPLQPTFSPGSLPFQPLAYRGP